MPGGLWGGGGWVGRGMLKLELIDALILRTKVRNNIWEIVGRIYLCIFGLTETQIGQWSPKGRVGHWGPCSVYTGNQFNS